MTALPVRTDISDTYPKPTNKQAKEALGQMWDVLSEISEKPEIELASSTTCDIGGQSSTKLRITGTTTIASFGENYRGPILVRMAASLTITHNSSTLICPGATDLITTASDVLLAFPKATAGVSDGWQVIRISHRGATYSDLGAVSIKDYGAVGDGGITNNKAAIEAAMSAAAGRKILVPVDAAGGDYAVTSGALTLSGVFEYETGARIYASGAGTITDGSRFIGFGGGGPGESGAANVTRGLLVELKAGNTVPASGIGLHYNMIRIANDIADGQAGGGTKVNGLLVSHTFGNSSTKGGRHALYGVLVQNAATSSSNTDRNYVGTVGQVISSTGDGGTPGAEKGGYFGGNFWASLNSGATNCLHVTGCEFDSSIYSGASALIRTGINMGMGGDVRGSIIDAAIGVWLLSGTTSTVKHGIRIGAPQAVPASSVLGTDSIGFEILQPGSINTGVLFSCPISSSILKWAPTDGSSVSIDPNNIILDRLNAGIELGRVGVTNTPTLDFHSSASVTGFDGRITSSGGSAVNGQGTLSYVAAMHSFTGGMKFGTFMADAAATIAGYITITDAAGNSRKLLVAA